ncbi:MAG TPA: hypothetical protein VKB59_20760, partial [Micromonosporaceae bacterium]|nr:hypothetical protein [Micromonosporaceae bacterium]
REGSAGSSLSPAFGRRTLGRLCPLPVVAYPPRVDDDSANQHIEWFDAFDVVGLVTDGGHASPASICLAPTRP